MLGHLLLIRGLPGSGKSTMAKELMKPLDAKHFEADMFFVDIHGNYEFDPSKLKDAHLWCKTVTKQALRNGHNVIVSNTFTQKWEMAVYIDMDCATFAVIEAKGEYESVHGVPKDKIQLMKNRWETI